MSVNPIVSLSSKRWSTKKFGRRRSQRVKTCWEEMKPKSEQHIILRLIVP